MMSEAAAPVPARLVEALRLDRCLLWGGDAAHLGDVLAPASVDAIVCDPPAGVGFMGKEWDLDRGGRDRWIAWLAAMLKPSFKALKPGGHALVWALPRTSHWTAMALELAGFEIRDVVVHLFGTGFPKSINVSKAIDKRLGAVREVVGSKLDRPGYHLTPGGAGSEAFGEGLNGHTFEQRVKASQITAPATPEAAAWEGWHTALKPAAEHWILARRPFVGTVAANVLEYGTAAINVDGCRIGTDDTRSRSGTRPANGWHMGANVVSGSPTGRWPANVTLDEEVAAILDAAVGVRTSGGRPRSDLRDRYRTNRRDGAISEEVAPGRCVADSGGASRFFFVAKGSRAEKDRGLEGFPRLTGGQATGREDGSAGTENPRGAGRTGGARNFHPTVKNIALCRWLVRLVTPPRGTVLDPFCGSGSIGVATLEEGFRYIGCELTPAYLPIAVARLRGALAQTTFDFG